MDESSDGNQCGSGENDAQKGEEAAELVLA
jgi:hypothetical protein